MRMRDKVRLGLALAALALAGTEAPGAAAAQVPDTGTVPIDRIVAIVGKKPILFSELTARLDEMRASGAPMPEDSAGMATLAHNVLDQLINEELLVEKAQAESLSVTPDDIAPAVDQQMKTVRSQFKSEQEFSDALRQDGFGSVDEYRSFLAERYRREALPRQLFGKLRQEQRLPNAPVTDQQIREFWEQNKGRLAKQPASVTLRQIVIAPAPSPLQDSLAKARADSILAEIKNGADFELLARRESMDPGSKDVGGDLGWHRRGDGLVPEFERMAFTMRPGVPSPVFRTSFGYHILRVDRVQPGEVKVRHILIRPAIDSSDVARAAHLADSVAQLWRAGASYDSLAATYHDPVEERVIPEPFPRDSLPSSYQQALQGVQVNAIADPFPIQGSVPGEPKFVIVQLTSERPAHEATLDEYHDRIREQLQQQGAIQRLLATLRKETYVAVFL